MEDNPKNGFRWIFQKQNVPEEQRIFQQIQNVNLNQDKVLEIKFFLSLQKNDNLLEPYISIIIHQQHQYMLEKKIKKSSSVTRLDCLDQNLFFIANGIQKRRIFYNVNYTEQEQRWIQTVRKALKKENKFQIKEDQVILRYFYSSDLILQKCLERLTKYHQWYTNPEIQSISEETKSIIRQGFVYCYGKAKDGRPFLIINLGILNLDKYSLTNYYQALNYALGKVIKQEFIPGYLETYYIIIDLDEKLLSLPITSLNNIIQVLSNVYSMLLQKMLVVNCTTISKWISNRAMSFLSEQTVRKISLHTKQDLKDGQLKTIIDFQVLQKKYGGIRHNINHYKQFKQKQKSSSKQEQQQLSETEYFSIEQTEDQQYYKQKSCCGIEQCSIY